MGEMIRPGCVCPSRVRLESEHGRLEGDKCSGQALLARASAGQHDWLVVQRCNRDFRLAGRKVSGYSVLGNLSGSKWFLVGRVGRLCKRARRRHDRLLPGVVMYYVDWKDHQPLTT